MLNFRSLKFISALIPVVCLLTVLTADAMELCLDTLGAGKYCGQLVKAVESGQVSCLVYLFGTFDDNGECLNRLVKTGKLNTVRVHLVNGPGLRNRSLGPYEPHRKFNIKSFNQGIERADSAAVEAIIEGAKQVEAATRGKVNCYISGVLEHNLSAKAASKLVELLRTNAPSCRVVNNPVDPKSPVLPGTVHELHGDMPALAAPCIVSLDGVRASSADLPAYVKRYGECELVFMWDQELNCRTDGAPIDPRKRSACPSASQLTALTALLKADRYSKQ